MFKSLSAALIAIFVLLIITFFIGSKMEASNYVNCRFCGNLVQFAKTCKCGYQCPTKKQYLIGLYNFRNGNVEGFTTRFGAPRTVEYKPGFNVKQDPVKWAVPSTILDENLQTLLYYVPVNMFSNDPNFIANNYNPHLQSKTPALIKR